MLQGLLHSPPSELSVETIVKTISELSVERAALSGGQRGILHANTLSVGGAREKFSPKGISVYALGEPYHTPH